MSLKNEIVSGLLPPRKLFYIALLVFSSPAVAGHVPSNDCTEAMQPVWPNGTAANDVAAPIEGILPIHFTTGRSVLSYETRRAIDQAVPQILGQLNSGGDVVISGYADPSGGPDETHSSSARRVKGVTNYLWDAWGIDPRRLVLKAYGTNLPAPDGTILAGANQRVLIDFRPHPSTTWQRTALPFDFRFIYYREYLDLDDFGGGKNPFAPRVSGKGELDFD